MKTYTGIGSRSTPLDVQALMEAYANHLAVKGWVLRSGGAEGADQAFQRGVHGGKKEIYLPWGGFNNFRHDPENGFYVAEEFGNWEEAQDIAAQLHPAWENCGQGARRLHTRNVYQVLGQNLDRPSEALICWAEPKGHGHVKGGTGMAVSIARQCGVNVINLYHTRNQEKIINIINEDLTR
tara:strand:+ start:3300 stop:3842 length:543 start_codon:yes stop_codon:yes gene_type:complete